MSTSAGNTSMVNDDRRRPSNGLVVTLLDMGDGTSRIAMDDVTNDSKSRDTSWTYDGFYTHMRLNSGAID
jgi:hypothetical protein